MTTYNEGYRCHWCGGQYENREYGPACSRDHRDKLRDEVGDEPYNPSINKEKEVVKIKSSADYRREMASEQIKLWAKFINHQLAAWAAIYELITGNKPPKIKEILAVISGH